MKANMDYETLRNSMTVQDAARVLKETNCYGTMDIAKNVILKALEGQPRWILVSEKLPEDLEPVNITWVNHNPESYYADIKDKPFTATGYYCKGRWYWYSSTCGDYLKEYGRCDADEIDADVEVIAWMPLPKPYKAESEDKND